MSTMSELHIRYSEGGAMDVLTVGRGDCLPIPELELSSDACIINSQSSDQVRKHRVIGVRPPQ